MPISDPADDESDRLADGPRAIGRQFYVGTNVISTLGQLCVPRCLRASYCWLDSVPQPSNEQRRNGRSAYTLSIVLAALVMTDPAHSENDVASAISYCRNYKGLFVIGDDNNIVCFDGRINARQDLGAVYKLKSNGAFVIRSIGGDVTTTIKLSNILMERNASVIIYDYCLSSCANYIFVASNETYVHKDTIIGWHGGPPKRDCGLVGERLNLRSGTSYNKQATEDRDTMICNITVLQNAFFKQRGIDDRFIYHPQTVYTKKYYKLAINGVGGRNIFWMWNPKNHENFFKTKITYEAYPPSQERVDEIIAGFRPSIRVIYDP